MKKHLLNEEAAKQQARHLGSCNMAQPDAPFPLTPALSLRERAFNSPVSLQPETIDDRQSIILPLPEGEGRGEGERRVRPRSGLLAAIALLVLLAVANRAPAQIFDQVSGEPGETHTLITINSDGTATVQSETSQSRATTEQQIRMWDQYLKSQEGDDEGETKPATPPESTEAAKPLSDEALAKKFNELMQDRGDAFEGPGDDLSGDLSVKVNKDTVQISRKRSFGNLEDLLRQASILRSMFDNLRLEKNADGHLSATFSPFPNMRRYAKSYRQQFKAAGFKEFKLVLPGKVISSGFPQTEGNTTAFVIDPKKEETIDAAMKLYDSPTVVVAELGGLKLDQPLNSKTLQRQARRGGGGSSSDLPITDAGPGFVAEPLSVTTTTIYFFPEAEKRTNIVAPYGGQRPGMQVTAKFFPPKGRTLQSVGGVRVLSAKDDKGRALVGSAEESAEPGSIEYRVSELETFVNTGRPGAGSSTQIRLELDLPQPDAQSIDELSAEAIAVTAGSWKQMTLPNIQPGATNEMDLGEVLSGAKMAISKFSNKNGQVRIQAQLKGSKEIAQLEIQVKSSSENFSSSMNQTRLNLKGNEASRNVVIQGYGFNERGQPDSGPLSLLVRLPQDVRRERVKFKLTALDLL